MLSKEMVSEDLKNKKNSRILSNLKILHLMNSHLTRSYCCLCTRVLGYRCMSSVFLSCSLTFLLIFFFHIFLLVCKSTHTLLPWPAGKGQRSTCLTQVSPFTMWGSGMKLRSSGFSGSALASSNLPGPLPYFWRQAILLKLELVDVARPAG